MKRFYMLMLFIFISTSNANSETFTCKIKDEGFAKLDAISWDFVTNSAKIKTLGNEQVGEVTNVREHNDGYKINIMVQHKEPYYGADLTEYIIFPAVSTYRVIGVTYKVINNRKFLDTSSVNYALECISL